MTELLYLRDHYLREFEAQVEKVDGDSIVLNRTAFYPTGGGQPNDLGKISWDGGEAQVVDVSKKTGIVLHKLKGATPQASTTVHGTIDWERRYAFMRYHSALHVLCGLVYHMYGGLVTGGQIYPEKARMDFDLQEISPERVQEIEKECNKIVQSGRPITIRFLPREEAMKHPDLIRTKINLLPPDIAEVRVVEIEGLDVQADGGTHVSNTKEIQDIKVVKTDNKGRINRRMEIVLSTP
ncbi:Ala-tRNA(Pro) hydrolase [archaeon RBG_16_50_20]|nr:MAG: Ala-tRNA(Pro) hydrolase [archaeon RBG_16_50_20]